MNIPKAPHGKKIKDWPLDFRLLLAFVGQLEKQQPENFTEVSKLAAFMGVTENEVAIALVKLVSAQQVAIVPDNITKPFEFTVVKEVRSAVLHDASSYRKHREAALAKKQRIATYVATRPGKGPRPAYLSEITAEMREPRMGEAKEMARRIAHPEFAKKMANCLVRLGTDEIETIVAQVEKLTEGRLRTFLKMYTNRRDGLLKPK